MQTATIVADKNPRNIIRSPQSSETETSKNDHQHNCPRGQISSRDRGEGEMLPFSFKR